MEATASGDFPNWAYSINLSPNSGRITDDLRSPFVWVSRFHAGTSTWDFDDALPYCDTHLEPSLATRRVFFCLFANGQVRAQSLRPAANSGRLAVSSDRLREFKTETVPLRQGSDCFGRAIRVQGEIGRTQHCPRRIPSEMGEQRLEHRYHRVGLQGLAKR